MFKSLALLALASVAITTGQTNYSPDAEIPFAQEPTEYGADADVAWVDEPGYTDANATQGLTFEDVDPNNRQLQVVESVVVGLQIAAVVAPMIADIIKGNRKECQQVACWIGTDSRTCGLSVAEKIQAEMMMGRDRFRYESIQPKGMWVRFWRTKFEPIDRDNIATGTCTNNVPFVVTNCQSTGRVHC